MPRRFLVACFQEEESLLNAVRTVRGKGLKVYDVFAPYPIHELGVAMGIRKSRLPLAALFGTLSGLLVAIGFQFYANVLDWPMNVGGKPDNSTLAFIPIAFELTILFGGLITVAALLVRTRLFPGKHEHLLADGITDDVFALALRQPDRRAVASALRQSDVWKILEACGAKDIYERESPP
ncbi:MAG TPA: DUF3341 domain-containing protein [Terriglobales bacterium]|nr:DUF3341 domain-containing protein [Terriglobales bacterium]